MATRFMYHTIKVTNSFKIMATRMRITGIRVTRTLSSVIIAINIGVCFIFNIYLVLE
jgi:hypothetical protein